MSTVPIAANIGWEWQAKITRAHVLILMSQVDHTLVTSFYLQTKKCGSRWHNISCCCSDLQLVLQFKICRNLLVTA